jgi:cobalamin-dependent methionine synthase I
VFNSKTAKQEQNIKYPLSDFIAPKDSGKTDYMGAFV